MSEIKTLNLDKYELGIIINSLTEFRNKLIKEEKDTSIVNELILKVLDAPDKKRMFKKKEHEER